MTIQSVEEYFRELVEIRSSGAGTKETSYYSALSNLLNGLGKSLKPRVRCILTLDKTWVVTVGKSPALLPGS